MSEKKLVPKRRFKKFQYKDAWEQCKLGEVAEVLDGDRGKNYPNASDFSVVGHTLFLSATNVKKSGFSLEATQFITQEKSDSMGNGKVQLNDIILTSRGTVGNIVVYDKQLQSVTENTRINSGMLLLRSSKVIDPKYIVQYLKSPLGSMQIELISFGSAQPQLTKKDVINYKINLPSFEEQTKIGNIFRQLDDSIALQQCKLEKTKAMKSAFLAEMFPAEGERVPKRRFAGFTNKWSKVRLNDISEIVGGGTPSSNVKEFWNGDIDWYSPTEIGNKVYANNSVRKITQMGLEKSSAKMLPADKTILFTSRAGIGSMAILKKQASTNQGFQSIVLGNEIHTYFIYSMGYLIKSYAMSKASGSTFLEISGKTLGEMPLVIPSLAEQQAIGMFFKKLDESITNQQQKLNKLKAMKQAYLQEMFV